MYTLHLKRNCHFITLSIMSFVNWLEELVYHMCSDRWIQDQDQTDSVHSTVDYISADYWESHCVFTDTGTNI